MSRGQTRLRSRATRRILERCQNKNNSGNAIIIDDDSENADESLIGNPSSSNVGSKNANMTGMNCLPSCVICIDDEEEEPSNLSRDRTSNQLNEYLNSSSLFEDSDSDDCVMFVGNESACCDQSGPSRNRFGLYVDSDSSTTESANLQSDTYFCGEFEGSSSDCEIMVDQSGNIREQWQKAASKKEGGPFTSDQANASSTTTSPEVPSHEPILQNADIGNFFETLPSNHCEEMLAEFDLRSPGNGEQMPSMTLHFADENIKLCQRTRVNTSVPQSYLNSHIPYEEPGNWWKDDDSTLRECRQIPRLKDDGLSLNEDEQEPDKDSFFTYQKHDKVSFSDKKEPSTKTSYGSPTSSREQVSNADVFCGEREEQNVNLSYNTQFKNEIVTEKILDYKETKKEDSNQSSPFCSRQYEETLIHAEASTESNNIDSNANNNVNEIETSNLGPASHIVSDIPNCYGDLIGERERHKKTDQYKRVAEEEWASRQQQVQIQAEEAQRMRRRRKAEKMRLFDMERRQKQRLQEIRDLHKKDEEITQLKERFRAEVRRDLARLELSCTDMASVMRALGIHVKGGVVPMAHEINAAYKQALLRFHPDRAPRTDIHQQVEAEEKFKLISRLKEKLLF